jgi:ribonuclease P protein component
VPNDQEKLEKTLSKKSIWIRRLQKDGKKETGRFLVVLYSIGHSESPQVAIVVSGKLGGAAIRNKIKRRLRELFRNKARRFLRRGYYLVIAKKAIVNAKFDQVESEILELIQSISVNA